MKALVITKPHQPLALEEGPDLEAASGQVIVKLKAAALNRRDFWITQGMYPGIKPGVILGSDGAGSLLDNTMLMYGSNFGDANKHTTDNMPVILAGGGFEHGKHLAFDREQNYPLPNLFVSMLQGMGIEIDRFASSTGTMTGLDLS